MQPEDVRMRCLEMTIDLVLSGDLKVNNGSEIAEFALRCAKFVVHEKIESGSWLQPSTKNFTVHEKIENGSCLESSTKNFTVHEGFKKTDS